MTSDLFERDTGPCSVPAGHLAWLDRELAGWQEQGRIDAATAAGIRGKYTASRQPQEQHNSGVLGLTTAQIEAELDWPPVAD